MSVIIGYRMLSQEAFAFFAVDSPNPSNMLNSFTEVSSQLNIGPSGVTSIRFSWSVPINPTSFAMQGWENFSPTAKWRINRYSSLVPSVPTLIDSSGQMLIRKTYSGASLVGTSGPNNSSYTVIDKFDGYVATRPAAAQSVLIDIFDTPGSTAYIGMLAVMETVALASAYADGQTGGGSLDQGSRVIYSFSGGVAPSDEQDIELANFHVSGMTPAEKNTLKAVQKEAGMTGPAWFQPYGFRPDSSDSIADGGLVRFASKFQVTPMRPQAGTSEDQFEARGVVVSPWI